MDKIVTLTLNPALDKSAEVDRLIAEEKLHCEFAKTEPGGGGINVSKGIKKLGGNSLAIFTAGGSTGKRMKNLLTALEVDYQAVEVESWTRENFIIVERSTNSQFRFGMPAHDISLHEAEACLNIIKSIKPIPTFLVASGSLPPGLPTDFYGRVAHLAKKLGSKFILDTSAEPLRVAANEGVFLLKPNLNELGKMVGNDSLDVTIADEAALEIIRKGHCEAVVVSLGPQGAILVTEKRVDHIPAPTVKKRSTVGAGDSMVAGITHFLSGGRSLIDSVRMGVACGTAATMNTGTELFQKADADRLYQWILTYQNRYASGNNV
jgi:6-phosphofructokinase 2